MMIYRPGKQRIRHQSTQEHQQQQTGDPGLHRLLWLLWIVAVAGFIALRRQIELGAGRVVDLPGLVISATLFGLVGLIIVTLIELRLEPERFIDWHEDKRRQER